jgi:hypothetical protein
MQSGPAPNYQRQEEFSLSSDVLALASVSSSSPPSVPPTTSSTTTRQFSKQFVQKTPLPDYSPHLPPIDRAKRGQAFYEDLLAKQLIPAARNLSLSHLKVSTSRGVQQYISFSWFAHAAKCAFYKVSPSLHRFTTVIDPLIESLGHETRRRNGHAPISTVPVVGAIDGEEMTERTQEGLPKVLERVHTVNDGEDKVPESSEREPKRLGDNLFWWYRGLALTVVRKVSLERTQDLTWSNLYQRPEKPRDDGRCSQVVTRMPEM